MAPDDTDQEQKTHAGDRALDSYPTFAAVGHQVAYNEDIIARFRANDGKLGGIFEGAPMLLLTTVGAKSGLKRTNPLAYFDFDGRWYLESFNVARPDQKEHPAWVHNLRATPEASVEITGGKTLPVTARELVDDEEYRRISERYYAVIGPQAAAFGRAKAKLRRIAFFELVRD